jgi:nitronate monooxygenase
MTFAVPAKGNNKVVMRQYPVIIQGGMGAGVSNWKLANTVSRTGQLGVVSGTALDVILARRLADGDPGGHMRRAMDAFPFPAIAERIWNKYWSPTGKARNASYPAVPVQTMEGPRESIELCMVGNFVEVFLAREGHDNPVGINYLEKIQFPHLPSIYGAMLAGVSYVLMGAGIPLKIPGVLDRLAEHQAAEYPVHVTGAQEQNNTFLHFAPRDYMDRDLPPLVRPDFLAIISSYTLGATLLKKANGKVNGLIIETKIAGGHNAPPRGKLQLSEAGEPIYGERDTIDIKKIQELGVPFWLAGGYGHPEMVRQALVEGATGVQVGTAFAFSEESGLRADYKRALLAKVLAGDAKVFTDPLASPTGFPFKVAQLEGTCSEATMYKARPRICDLGFLREAYRKEDGTIGYRCASEPVSVYLAKGGQVEDTVGRKCVCNALIANIGQPQVRKERHTEHGLVTAGDDLSNIGCYLSPGRSSYSATEVVTSLLSLVHGDQPVRDDEAAQEGEGQGPWAEELCFHGAALA